MKQYTIASTKKLPDSEVRIDATITTAALDTYKDKAFKKIAAAAELPGFRKGHVPEEKLRQEIGELGLLEEAAEMAINDSAVEIIAESKVNFLGRPKIGITKIAPGSPVEFSITVAVMPEITLPDYKKIAKKENAKKEEIEPVTDKQIDETIEEIRRLYAKRNHAHAPGETHDDKEELPLPEVTDEFVKKLGDFKDIADFRAKLAENIAAEKKQKAKEKKRLAILEAVAGAAKVEMPKLLIASELDKMEGQFKADIAGMGLQPDDYLKHIKKTWEELRTEWQPDAEKRAKVQLVLQKISLEEKIEPAKDEIEKEIMHLMEHYKDADPERVRAYVEMILVNEKVLEFLEGVK